MPLLKSNNIDRSLCSKSNNGDRSSLARRQTVLWNKVFGSSVTSQPASSAQPGKFVCESREYQSPKLMRRCHFQQSFVLPDDLTLSAQGLTNIRYPPAPGILASLLHTTQKARMIALSVQRPSLELTFMRVAATGRTFLKRVNDNAKGLRAAALIYAWSAGEMRAFGGQSRGGIAAFGADIGR